MSNRVEIIPAVMPADSDALSSSAAQVVTFSPWAQLDVMDGIFTSEASWPYTTQYSWLETLERDGLPDALSWEVHLMVNEPHEIGVALIEAGARRVIVHVEAFADARSLVSACNLLGGGAAELGISLLLETPLEHIVPAVSCEGLSTIQIMGIAEIGAQGHVFDERTVERVTRTRTQFPQLTIAVDGGVSADNVAKLVAAGASRFAVGSHIMRTDNPAAAYEQLVRIANDTL